MGKAGTPLVELPEVIREERDEFGPDLVLWDESNERSLINIVPNVMKLAMKEMDVRFRYMSETELNRKCRPDPVDARLRLAFWDEYNLAQDNNRNMKTANIIRGTATIDYWDVRILTDPLKLAYICMPPKDYIASMKALLDLGIERYQEILELPLHDRKGNLNTRLIGEIRSIVQMIDQRIKGAVVQKHQVLQKNLNVNVEHHNDQLLTASSMEELENRLKTIGEQLKRIEAPAIPEVIPALEVTSGPPKED